MPDKLFLRPLPPFATQRPKYQWALYDISAAKLSFGRNVELEEIEQVLMQNGVERFTAHLLWPSNLAFSSKVSIPGKQTRYLQQAITFAIEEQLSQDLDLVHLATGRKTKQGDYPVIALDKPLFLSVYDDIAGSDLNLDSAHVDASLLPLQDYDMVISLDDGQALICSHKYQSITTLESNLTAYLDSVFLGTAEDPANEGGPYRIKIYLTNEDAYGLLLSEIQQYPNVEIEIETVAISQFELLCEAYFHESAHVIDLCQGDFKIARQGAARWQQWRLVASIAVIAFFLQLGIFVGKGMYYQAQADQVGAQAVAAYKQVVPGGRSISADRLPRILKGKLNQLRNLGGERKGFLELLGEAGYQYKGLASKSGLRFTSVNYSEQRGELLIELQSKNFEQLDSLKKAIVSAGLNAKISSAVQEDNYFRGRLSVSGS